MTDRLYTPDVEISSAWDVFVSSLDPVQLEAERMRAPKAGERFGSREHHEVVHAHNRRRLEFRRQLSLAPVPYWFAEWQVNVAKRALMGAEPATRGAVGRSERVTPASAGENISAKVNPATGHVASKVSTSQGKPVTTERKAA